jgi:hypothetical protein
MYSEKLASNTSTFFILEPKLSFWPREIQFNFCSHSTSFSLSAKSELPARFRLFFPTQTAGWLYSSLVLLAPCLLFWVPHRLCHALKKEPPAQPSRAGNVCPVTDRSD